MARGRRVLRWALVVIGVVVLLVVAAVGAMASAFIGNAQAVDGTRLPGGAVLVRDGFANVYVLPAGAGKVALIDCGMDAEGKAVTAALAKQGLTPASVEAVFITHGHADHTGGCKAFPRARLHALAAEVGLVEGTATVASPMTTVMRQPVRANGLQVAEPPLTDGQTVQVGPLSVRVLAMPGHTPGSAAYLAAGVLYVGDAANITTGGALRNTAWVFSTDPGQGARSLRTVSQRLQGEGMTPMIVAPSHSAPAPGATLTAFAAAQ